MLNIRPPYKRDRSPFYWVKYTDTDGILHRESTRSTDKTGAMKFIADLKEKLAAREQEAQLASSPMLSAFMEMFCTHILANNRVKTERSYRTTLTGFLRVVGDIPIRDVNREIIDSYIVALKKRPSPRRSSMGGTLSLHTIDSYLGTLQTAFAYACDRDMIEKNPFERIKFDAGDAEEHYVRREDFLKLYNECAKVDIRIMSATDFCDFILTAVMTGAREGEILALTWSDVDFLQNTITLVNSVYHMTKSKRTRTVPMSPRLAPFLMRRKDASSCQWIFHREGQPITDASPLSRAFKTAVLASGLDPKLTVHSLRHTFGTWLIQDGAAIYEVSKLLGHSATTVTERYLHLKAVELTGGVKLMTKAIDDAFGVLGKKLDPKKEVRTKKGTALTLLRDGSSGQ